MAVAAVVGIAIWRVSKSLADMERQRDDDAKAQKKSERILLLIGFSDHLGAFLKVVSAAHKSFGNENGIAALATNEDARRDIVHFLESVRFEIPDTTRSRMHYLDLYEAGIILSAEVATKHWINAINILGEISNPEHALRNAQQIVAAFKVAEEQIAPISKKCIEAKELAKTMGTERLQETGTSQGAGSSASADQ